MTSHDFTQRFLFDETDVRGELATLDRSYAEVLAKHPYPEPVAQLLGEMLAAAALLCGTLKFEGLLVLQARSSGPIPLLMVECSSEREVRGIARYEEEAISASASLGELMPDGVLALTIDPRHGQRYQGIVPLEGANLAECLSGYFATSEQLPTRFWLNADGRRARGLLLQQLPPARIKDAQARQDSWEHVVTLADTLTAEELLGLDNEVILHRLFHEETVRLFDEQGVAFNCSCSRDRAANALVSMDRLEVETLLDEQQGKIRVDCQFCNEQQVFDAADIAQIFAGGGTQTPGNTRH
ncbi:Hsp33 family molecular chaperone HslO [Pseudomonas oryzihabitans]|uniref:33 kDa chaperonin n=1 Tax=Pseudomonas oryzihabitans TaxID=47885 RepID=A0AAJ2BM38_9PSED|nr:Hsp33 family molecular chaperone HslO [Pseudomonas psychrotolerans]MDR6234880.1 molecular chaperone Hsp33 [Pseudomonas psychrotolerans]MDR6355937.1 molecular chaperone Hsp33 [Pseudomonas psychrotolerans]